LRTDRIPLARGPLPIWTVSLDHLVRGCRVVCEQLPSVRDAPAFLVVDEELIPKKASVRLLLLAFSRARAYRARTSIVYEVPARHAVVVGLGVRLHDV